MALAHFRSRHFGAKHFASQHFAGIVVVAVLLSTVPVGGGSAPGRRGVLMDVGHDEALDQIRRDDEEVLLLIAQVFVRVVQ
ncbi:MAG TPA: hypothetical protein VN667_11270 [Burkholderiales bacterium]|nr:hypothetical protein [Burkholderiales bacterium]